MIVLSRYSLTAFYSSREGKEESKCSLSSAGDELPVHKLEPTKISVVESREQCEGIERLKKLQNYVAQCEKQACAKEKSANKTVKERECQEPVAVESECVESSPDLKSKSKRALKREPKPPKVNPYLADPRRKDHPLLPVPRPPRSVEIIGGDVLGQCECVKRNGLQHDCPKWECRGTDLCLEWPMPACQPSGLGTPIIKESRVKKPDPPNCELTPSEQEMAEKALAKERRKEEVRLIELARDNWKNGMQQANIQKAANMQKGYLKCKIHSGMYRLVPLMKSAKTQTDLIENIENLRICPCEEVEKLEKTESKTKAGTNEESPVTEMTGSLKKEPANQESVRTSTTGIPTAKALKEKLKKPAK